MGERLFNRWPLMLAAVLAAAVMAGCTSDDETPPTAADPTPSAPGQTAPEPATIGPATGEAMELSVLEYNVEYGGNPSTDQVIQSLDADVVGVLESYNRLPEIAANTGYPYYNVGLQLLSKYPILEPSGADGLYALIEVQPGYAVAFFNTHLDYVAYGPRLLASGRSVPDVVASENEVRTSSLRYQLPFLEDLSTAGWPVFLTGDFNEPSSLDYTDETAGTRPGIDRAVPWPVSEALFGIGLRDSFRDAHPDPVENPGITWGNIDQPAKAGDRIDYVYTGGPTKTLDSRLVGEPGAANVDVPVKDWTSDHRAVISRFALTPVAVPEMVALNSRMLTRGDDLTVTYNAPDPTAASIALVPTGAGADEAVDEQAVDATAGTLTFSTGGLPPDGYDAVLLGADGAEIARNQFWVRPTATSVELSTDQARYRVGEPVEVSWDDGPANRWDWLTVFKAGASKPGTDDYLLWGYTGGHDSGALPPSVSGAITLDGSSQGNPWPLPPGRYVVHYLLTDLYDSAGTTSFTVRRQR